MVMMSSLRTLLAGLVRGGGDCRWIEDSSTASPIISREYGSHAGVRALPPYVQSIWSLLFSHCECPEEGTRNVVSECLGKLTLIDPPTLLPNLKQHLGSPSPYTRSTVVTAIKFTITDQVTIVCRVCHGSKAHIGMKSLIHEICLNGYTNLISKPGMLLVLIIASVIGCNWPQGIDSLLRSCIADFLRTLQDPDINVQRVALVTFSLAGHNKQSEIQDLLGTVLPHLYNETKVRKELIREDEMHPFRHTLDDGFDIRQVGLDRLVEPVRATCTTNVKANSVKQEFEKQDELKWSSMRAVVTLLTAPFADINPQMNEFLTQIRDNMSLLPCLKVLRRMHQPRHLTPL